VEKLENLHRNIQGNIKTIHGNKKKKGNKNEQVQTTEYLRGKPRYKPKHPEGI